MEAGAYGRCVDCRQPIVASRLHARPFAVRCRACQEAVEGRARGSHPSLMPSAMDWEPRESTPRLHRGLRGGRGEATVVARRSAAPPPRPTSERRP
jgi:hypothetical protein